MARDREPWLVEWHDYYAALGVPDYQVRHVTSQMLERLFRAKTQVVHPDSLAPGATDSDRHQAQQDFKLLVTARDTLVDRDRRRSYDAVYYGRLRSGYSPASSRRRRSLPLDQLILAGLLGVALIAGLIYLIVASVL